MQLIVDNTGGQLMTGAFANVRLEIAAPDKAIYVPASALIFDQSGLQVATLGADDRVVLKTVAIARDLGREIEIASGLTADDRVIVTPPDGIAPGDQVRVADRTGGPGAASATRNAPSAP
jgi:multidrug efflux pump subunit AcrA (membrane-fusion protein)